MTPRKWNKIPEPLLEFPERQIHRVEIAGLWRWCPTVCVRITSYLVGKPATVHVAILKSVFVLAKSAADASQPIYGLFQINGSTIIAVTGLPMNLPIRSSIAAVWPDTANMKASLRGS